MPPGAGGPRTQKNRATPHSQSLLKPLTCTGRRTHHSLPTFNVPLLIGFGRQAPPPPILTTSFNTDPQCGIFRSDRQRGQIAWPRTISLAHSNFMLPLRLHLRPDSSLLGLATLPLPRPRAAKCRGPHSTRHSKAPSSTPSRDPNPFALAIPIHLRRVIG